MNDIDDVNEWPPIMLRILQDLWDDSGIKIAHTKAHLLNVQDTAD